MMKSKKKAKLRGTKPITSRKRGQVPSSATDQPFVVLEGTDRDGVSKLSEGMLFRYIERNVDRFAVPEDIIGHIHIEDIQTDSPISPYGNAGFSCTVRRDDDTVMMRIWALKNLTFIGEYFPANGGTTQVMEPASFSETMPEGLTLYRKQTIDISDELPEDQIRIQVLRSIAAVQNGSIFIRRAAYWYYLWVRESREDRWLPILSLKSLSTEHLPPDNPRDQVAEFEMHDADGKRILLIRLLANGGFDCTYYSPDNEAITRRECVFISFDKKDFCLYPHSDAEDTCLDFITDYVKGLTVVSKHIPEYLPRMLNDFPVPVK